MGVFKGLKIRINENIFRVKRDGLNERGHLIHGRFNADDGTGYEAKCTMGFRRGKLRLSSNTAQRYTTLEVKDSRDPEWQHCFTHQQPVNFKSYLIMAASTEKHGGASNHHYVHSFNFWDMEGPTESSKKFTDDQLDENFGKKGKKFDVASGDLLHMINRDSELANNSTRAIDAYNDQLVAHSTRYAKLIGSVFRNQHLAFKIAKSFPTEDFMAELNEKISELRTIQTAVTEHFQTIMATFT